MKLNIKYHNKIKKQQYKIDNKKLNNEFDKKNNYIENLVFYLIIKEFKIM